MKKIITISIFAAILACAIPAAAQKGYSIAAKTAAGC